MRVNAVDARHHFGILANLGKTLGGEALQEHHRILTGSAPEVRINVAEKVFCIAVPNPPEVFSDLFQWLQLCRKLSGDCRVAPYRRVCVAYLDFHKSSIK